MKNDKKIWWAVSLGAVCAALITSGCAHMSDTSASEHDIIARGVALPPGWHLVSHTVTNSPTFNEVTSFESQIAGPTNQFGFWQSLVAPRPKFFVAYEERWKDSSKGGGTFVFTDPTASQVLFTRTNQTALGGGHMAAVGQLASVANTNAITAAASGVGQIVGAALKTAAK